MAKFTFDLNPPKDFENKLIIVEAETRESAKPKLLKELHTLNKKYIRVIDVPRTKEEVLEIYTDTLEEIFTRCLSNETYDRDEIERFLKDMYEGIKPND